MAKKTTDVTVVEKELNPLLSKAKLLIIRGPADMEIAAEGLSQLNIARDRYIEQMETITKPQKDAIKAAEAVWKPFINAAKEAISEIRSKVSDYQTEAIQKTREGAEIISSRTKPGKGNLTIETAVRKLEELEKPAAQVMAASGSLRFQESPVFEVMDITMLPVEYIKADEVKIRKAMLAGIKLPGVKYSTKQVPINNR